MKYDSTTPLYPIREVCRLTGVKPITLRAWERRYDLLEPVRTESGHRLYTQNHIDFLKKVMHLTQDEGIPISRVKAFIDDESMPTDHWQELQDAHMMPEEFTQQLIESLLEALYDFHIPRIEQLLDRIFADNQHKALLKLLNKIEKRLVAEKKSPIALEFWHSATARRFFVRQHYLQALAQTPRAKIFITASAETPKWLTGLIACFCYEQNYQPLVLDKTLDLEVLEPEIQTLHLSGLIFIDEKMNYMPQWQAWSKHYASLKTWILGDDSIEDQTPPGINAELRSRANWLAPLNS
jgi:DNA-binding transcriptional MerR regulator